VIVFLSCPKQGVAFSQSGWLITKLKDGLWYGSAVGDGKYVWVWREGDKGVWLVDSSGHIVNDQAKFLPDLAPSSGIVPIDDENRHGLVPIGNHGLWNVCVIGQSGAESSPTPLLPAWYNSIGLYKTLEGIWIHCANTVGTPPTSLEKGFYFFFDRNLKLEGPWKEVEILTSQGLRP
jgi:hypothetical protein